MYALPLLDFVCVVFLCFLRVRFGSGVCYLPGCHGECAVPPLSACMCVRRLRLGVEERPVSNVSGMPA